MQNASGVRSRTGGYSARVGSSRCTICPCRAPTWPTSSLDRSSGLTPRPLQERPAWIAKMQDELQEVPEYRPTEEEFSDPFSYIRSIAAEGSR